MDDSEKYERARIELIESELQNVRNHLCAAAEHLADSNHLKAAEVLEKAQYSYALASFHIEKMSPARGSLGDLAQTLHKEIEELEQQIKRNSNNL
jgi:predicted DNA-binding transcriptional regulator